MEVRKPTTSDAKRLLHIYAADSLDPSSYVVWFEGRDMRVKRQGGESAADLWLRVCSTVEHMRQVVRRGTLQGREFAFAHVYAGVTPTEADERERWREWIVWSLWQQVDDRKKNSDHMARVQALCLLAEIHGFLPATHVQTELHYQ
jgi:hypothetical protein